jgi:ribosomal protein S27E
MEGCGNFIDATCALCSDEQAIYRYQLCAFRHLLCKKCIVKTHGLNPLHVIEVHGYVVWYHL